MSTEEDSRDDLARILNEAVGRRIKTIRLANGHSQQTLGRVLDLTFQQIQKYERGSNKISAEKLWRIARHYNVDLNYFVQDLAITGAQSAGSAPIMDESPHERLRLEIGREIPHLPVRVLRAILNLMRSTAGTPKAN